MKAEEHIEFAISLVQECGQIILEASKGRENPSDLVTETDKIVEELTIIKETAAAGNHHEPTWIVDPIDGTTNFILSEIIKATLSLLFPFVAVYIGLTNNKEPVVARKGNGAYLNLNTKLPLSSPNPPITLPSSLSQCLVMPGYGNNRSFNDFREKFRSVHSLMSKPVRGIRNIGSAALSIIQVAKGEADIFWEIGCWEWDVTAALVILRESGGLIVNGNGPNEEPVNILGRKYLAVRGGSPCAGDKTVEQSQLRLVREFWNIVEEIDCPRE
ncbi:hypothetical protein C1646_684771 [Rhizophagus diaphanus]|nr:hypothetical protein C1646_684771 [Rhizophagus diaphanus] [Rhizophagus sp. MUCL 43196]